MNVEAGPSGAIAGAASVSGPSIGIGAPFGIVNEGPIRGSLEGFRPMDITDIQPIDKGGVVNSLTAEGAISQAEAIISESLSTTSAVKEAQYWLGVVEPKPEPDTKLPTIVGSLVYPVASPSISSQAEAVYAPATQEQLIDEIVAEEEIIAEERKDESSKIREEGEVEELKLKYVEHEEVSRQRRYQLEQAINKADAETKEGDEEIAGDTLKKYFAPEDQSNRSGIAEPGVPDGSLEETYQILAARNYGSAREAKEVADATVAELKPVKKAKEGKKVREIDIARVRRDLFFKSHPVEEVVARIVKKKILAEKTGQSAVLVHELKSETLEPTIEDLDLAEVFPTKSH